MTKMTGTIVTRKNEVEEAIPKQYPDGKYVASSSKFEVDYIRVDTIDELASLVRSGLSARMWSSKLNLAPSLIRAKNIYIAGDIKDESLIPTVEQYLTFFAAKEDLDTKTVINARVEQGFLRSFLVSEYKQKDCYICGKTLPIELLMAAHIKKRAKCKLNEKLDFENVAALICKLGCDDFFDKGYLCVVNGKVTLNPERQKETTEYLDDVIGRLEGKKGKNSEQSNHYYDCHAKYYLNKKQYKKASSGESKVV
jgi:hypothetical protein